MTAGRERETRPTRRAIMEILQSSPAGLTTAELARALGLHPNGVRKQLQSLVRDGSVGSQREVSGRRGRPAVRYRAAAERRETVAAQRFAAALAELVGEMDPDEARVEEFGRRQALKLATAADGRSALLDMLTTMGFSPREQTGVGGVREGRLDVVLGHCPFASAVEAEGGGRLVCVLHRGISRGLVEITPAARMTDFEIRPPEVAGCRIVAEGLAPLAVADEGQVGDADQVVRRAGDPGERLEGP
jgi:predicted ArsR family transcriptional regulator